MVLAGLSHLEELVGEHARPAVETLLDGPHDGLAVQWLMSAGALAAEDVGPERLLASGVDMLAVALEIGGPEELLAVFGAGERADQIELLEGLWRVERPRTAELLEAIGAHHPDRSVAKAARKCLVRHRGRIANSRLTGLKKRALTEAFRTGPRSAFSPRLPRRTRPSRGWPVTGRPAAASARSGGSPPPRCARPCPPGR